MIYIYLNFRCFYHAHNCSVNKIYARDSEHPLKNTTMQEVYDATLRFDKQVSDAGYRLVVMWECQYPGRLNFDEQYTPLIPSDAYFGGRTEVFQSVAHADEKREIKYRDITSLYPYVLKWRTFPEGHPTFFPGVRDPDRRQHAHEEYVRGKYFGLAKVIILPPKHLLIPVLPYRYKQKLHFPLCYSCVVEDTNNKEILDDIPSCEHTQSERCLQGTWCTQEIDKAIEMGYRIIGIEGIWHWDEAHRSTHDVKSGTIGTFAKFIDLFYKMKAQAQGFPKHVCTEEEKDQYIEEIFQREGILLEKDKIHLNPGLKMCAKILLNSFYGKFGQKENKLQVRDCIEIDEINKICFSDQYVVVWCDPIPGSEWIRCVFRERKEFQKRVPKINVVIAAMTTAWSRLELYDALSKLDSRAIYCDTDSVIYYHPRIDGDGANSECLPYEPTLGPHLGQWTDEVEPNHIKSVVCRGPKSYAIRHEEPETKDIIKMKGVVMSHRTKKFLNFDSMLSLNTSSKIRVKQVHFSRSSSQQVRIHKVEKNVRETMKRKHDPEDSNKYMCYPLGYRHPQPYKRARLI